MFPLYLITACLLYYLVSVLLNVQVEVLDKEALPSVMTAVKSGMNCSYGRYVPRYVPSTASETSGDLTSMSLLASPMNTVQGLKCSLTLR